MNHFAKNLNDGPRKAHHLTVQGINMHIVYQLYHQVNLAS